jgi:hypothetical protein
MQAAYLREVIERLLYLCEAVVVHNGDGGVVVSQGLVAACLTVGFLCKKRIIEIVHMRVLSRDFTDVGIKFQFEN